MTGEFSARTLMIGLCLGMLGGCATGRVSPSPAASPPPVASGGDCDAGPAQAFLGRSGNTVADDARVAAGARTVRIVRPGQAVTMDFRPDRLTLDLDPADKIVAARCG